MVLAAGLLIFGKLNSISEDHLFVKKFFARDLAVLMDAMHVPEGNILYFYTTQPNILSKLNFAFKNNIIEVNDEKYPMAVHLSEETTIEKPQQLRILKKNNQIFVEKEAPTPQEPYNPNAINCPQKPIIGGTIVLDPGHGYNPTEQGYQGTKGVEGQQGQESKLMAQTAQALQSLLTLKGKNVLTTRALTIEVEDAKNIDDRKNAAKQGDVIISIHTNQDKKENNNIKAYINYDSPNYAESYSLACALLNSLSNTFIAQTTGTAIIPVKINQLDQDDDKRILETNNIAVQIELGNINGTTAFLQQTKNVANALAQAFT
ncbi:N-acetylmuramoyl-L-alanine amidase [Candidatus Woesearchaeota archaeon]|nr:N-acetylmuramoyl-L-alanine amidase [Candidatus Woesearchaeota archaeon]